MKRFIGLLLFLCALICCHAQSVEILGSAKVSAMPTSSTATANVVRLSDGTLGVRKYQPGDFAQGGIVFWVDESGEHGLVAAKADQSANMRWFAGSLILTQAKGDGAYAGEMNTMIAIAGHTGTSDDGVAYAARLCAELVVTEDGFTYGDWYLPSKYELNEMQVNQSVIDSTALAHGGTTFAAFFSYWSSTEATFSNAWSQNITSGVQASSSKSGVLRVRAIRAF